MTATATNIPAVTPSDAAATTWTIDPAHSLVEFSVKHMMIATVKGRFRDVSGTITLNEAEPARSSVAVELGAESIDTGVTQRDDHLRSADFFDVEAHPKLVFTTRRVEGAFAQAGDRFRIVGDLSIRGVGREVVLDATYEGRGRDPWGGDRIAFTADTRLDRREYGLGWNQALETGGVLVSNEIRIHLEVQAVRA
jgi:polyisoprenoid-binding protein YceI